MSRGELVADAVRRGAGRAAMVLGMWCEAYRPATPERPLAAQNRFLRLQASFSPPGEGNRPPGYGSALWWGVFDSAYTRVGDYIRRPESRPGAGDGAVWFVASQEPMLPVLCVYADLLGVAGGAFVSVVAMGIQPRLYLDQTIHAVTLAHLFGGIVKATTYGLLIGIAGCFIGLRAGRSAATRATSARLSEIRPARRSSAGSRLASARS